MARLSAATKIDHVNSEAEKLKKKKHLAPSNHLFILKDKKPKPVTDLLEWGEWMEKNTRRVKETVVGEVRISTVFLGLNHGFSSAVEPMLFETMIFGGELDGFMNRYSTWVKAEEGHKNAVEKVLCTKLV